MHFPSPLSAFTYWEANKPDKFLFHQPFEDSVHHITYRAAGIEIRKIANGLIDLGYKPKSKIALLSKNCSHWIMADLAIQMAGYVSVPIYPTISAQSIDEIIVHSETKAVIIGKLDDYAAQKPGVTACLRIGIKAYHINEELSWEDFVDQNAPLDVLPDQQPEELLTIMYTSGTTGAPKGVMHKVGSFSKVTNTAIDVFGYRSETPKFFSYLPLTHIAERIGIEMFGLFIGGSFTFPYSLETFSDDLSNTQPNMFFAVPRIWTKFQEGILSKIPQKKLDLILSIPIISSFFKKKIKAKLGLSKAINIFTGAAPIALSQLEWYHKLGIEICQAYGMTEDCVLSHFNYPGQNKFGTVGKPLPGVQIKFSSEDEILIKSDCLMLGYYKEPAMTKDMFTEDGFLRTGDIGEYDHEGYLIITGRIKDQFKTDKGKYISPAPIEMELMRNTDLDQVCIVGMGIPQPIALVMLSQNAKNKSEIEIAASLSQTVNELNPKLESVAKVQKVVIMKEDWTIDNGLLTPTLKVKRNRVEKIHQDMYKGWYDNEKMVIFE